MTPKPRDLNPSGLGRAIINRKVKDARIREQSGLYAVDVDSTTRLKSVTQERDLDEFLNTAQLAGTEFTAERRNVKIIQQTASLQNPYLLDEAQEKVALEQHRQNKKSLRVPRRPPWKKSMTPAELERQEKSAFLDWRRGLAELQDQKGLLLTPFERNLEVWRQLWRVLERSHLVVQIVDARNPLRFRCEDLESYVEDVEGVEGEAGSGPGRRRSLLLINKADLLTAEQRKIWADYFDEQNIQFAFFSAALAADLQQTRRELAEGIEQHQNPLEGDNVDDEAEGVVHGAVDDEEPEDSDSEDLSDDEQGAYHSAEEESEGQDPRTKILSVVELEDMFTKLAPDISHLVDAAGKPQTKLVVGLVGYPNVGKSSTINALLGEKKVSVSSTPGKTKHFQTIHLTESIVLCDCPGLVFPQFATTKAELVCDGVLPIDQMREHTGPIALLVKRLPREVIEATYGLRVRTRGVEEGGDGKMTAEDLLVAYAIARGYTRAGQGNPDEARAARYILKDYVNAKLLFFHPPPGTTERVFNKTSFANAIERASGRKLAPTTRVGKDADTFVHSEARGEPTDQSLPAQGLGLKSRTLDKEFFERNSALSSRPIVQGSIRNGEEFTRATLFPHQRAVGDDGRPLQNPVVQMLAPNKKGHKKVKRGKQRSGRGYD